MGEGGISEVVGDLGGPKADMNERTGKSESARMLFLHAACTSGVTHYAPLERGMVVAQTALACAKPSALQASQAYLMYSMISLATESCRSGAWGDVIIDVTTVGRDSGVQASTVGNQTGSRSSPGDK